MRSTERRKVNVLEMNCLRSLVGVSRMDRVRYKEVRRRAGIEKQFLSTLDQRVFSWFGHVERMDEYRMARMVWRACMGYTEVRLDGWREDSLGQQRHDGGGYATMRKIVSLVLM